MQTLTHCLTLLPSHTLSSVLLSLQTPPPPGEDPTLISKQQIFARIVGALGGRAAEEVIFGEAEVTSGASGDLQQVRRGYCCCGRPQHDDSSAFLCDRAEGVPNSGSTDTTVVG